MDYPDKDKIIELVNIDKWTNAEEVEAVKQMRLLFWHWFRSDPKKTKADLLIERSKRMEEINKN